MDGIDSKVNNVFLSEPGTEDSRKIKLLLIITGLAVGGATNVVLNIGSYFSNHPDFEVQLITGPIPPGRSDVTHLTHEQGISTQVVPSLINDISPITNARAVADIRRIITREKFDIVHTHSTVAGIIGRLAAFSARVPVILHHVHGWGFNGELSRSSRLVCLNLERICARFTRRIIAVSSPDIYEGLDHGIGNESKYALIFNGIDLEKFQQPVDEQEVRAELGLRPNSKIVGMIGRLDKQKNPLDFIRAAEIVAKEYSNVEFLFVGDGLLRSDCERLIRKLGLQDSVFLLGYRSDVSRLLRVMTITAMSSLWEGLPLAFLESMSAGKPIVANDVNGARDVVKNGETGFLVTPHKPEEMAEHILLLLNNEALCHRMGVIAERRSKEFSVQSMFKRLETLYRNHYSPIQFPIEDKSERLQHA